MIRTIALMIALYMPSSYEMLAESPTTGETIVVKAIEAEIIEESPIEQPEVLSVEATHYTAYCEGCIGITAIGYDVRRTIYAEGYRVIAVDNSVIPLRSIVRVTYEDGTTFEAVAGDVGGDIKGARIDVLVASKSEAYALGRQQVSVEILEYGGGR